MARRTKVMFREKLLEESSGAIKKPPKKEKPKSAYDGVEFESYSGTTFLDEETVADSSTHLDITRRDQPAEESDITAPVGDPPTFALICPLIQSKNVLAEGQELSIGRSPEADITLPSKKVSRKHASIKFDGHSYSIHDHNSTNGTFVNGSRVHRRRRLRHGMKIDIDAFSFEVVELASPDEDIDLRNDLDANDETVVDIGAALSGTLEDVGVPNVLQLIETTGKTGRLTFLHKHTKGQVWIDEGTVIHAEFGPEYGLRAALQLFGLSHGRFEFRRGPVNCPNTVMKPTTFLLMEAARMVDESSGA